MRIPPEHKGFQFPDCLNPPSNVLAIPFAPAFNRERYLRRPQNKEREKHHHFIALFLEKPDVAHQTFHLRDAVPNRLLQFTQPGRRDCLSVPDAPSLRARR
jgi:hypothetical protein